MRLPRDLSGSDLAKALEHYGYELTRQTGSHLRLSREGEEPHHITIPAHRSLKVGTLSAILRSVARHLGKSRDEVVEKLFG